MRAVSLPPCVRRGLTKIGRQKVGLPFISHVITIRLLLLLLGEKPNASRNETHTQVKKKKSTPLLKKSTKIKKELLCVFSFYVKFWVTSNRSH